MEEDDPSSTLAHKAQHLQTLISPLSSSTSKLSGKSRTIPSNKDFHFYNSFREFKLPNREISAKVQSSLDSLSSSSNLFGEKKQPPLPDDLDDSYDWLVNLNDDFIEKFNISLDEFKRQREKEEGKVGNLGLEEGGFQLVNRNKKKKGNLMDEFGKHESLGSSSGIKVGLKDRKAVGGKSKVPFHIPTIRRPQDEFNILVNNVNKPFEHVWLERSEDGNRVIHPLERLSVEDFIDRSIEEVEIAKPLPLDSTPFVLVDGLKELKELAAKLRNVNEFAVDLEHNQYRSFQGLTCLMQISTRAEDFIIDTLKLRVHVGPYLREVFKDPSKRKVMHGADRDVEWLQRDFGIYICNLFDTGQASRVLQLERNSLEYLLHHFCGVNANKEYQNADWRLRPLPDEMIKYGREDTHYLLYVYDLMRHRLISASTDEDDLLLEVYKRSYDLCLHLYQKEILTDNSFLYIYGLQEADFNPKQLSIASALHAWRDKVAREEDESTGYVLPNKALLEIAREMPISTSKLRRLVKSKHSVVERNLSTVTTLIKNAIEKSSGFESIAEELKNTRLEPNRQKMAEGGTDIEMLAGTEDPVDSTVSHTKDPDVTGNIKIIQASVDAMDEGAKPTDAEKLWGISDGKPQEKGDVHSISTPNIDRPSKICDTLGTNEGKMEYDNTGLSQPKKMASIGSVQILKKQTSGFGALLGNSASRKKLNPVIRGIREQDKNVNKVEQIKSSVVLPFHSFSGSDKISEPSPSETIKQTDPAARQQQNSNQPSPITQLEEIIQLENNNDSDEEILTTDQETTEAVEKPISLSDLSSSFQQCFQSISEKNRRPSQENEVRIQVKPFDYAAARRNIEFGGVEEHFKDAELDNNPSESTEKRKGSDKGRSSGEERVRGLRRQAFPASGNRSTSYK
ncbi:uncharacterized protein A4U43_C05F16920 [Asparagus officinalis]|uniref:HRDC domain-containing protein n=1 Tax=Asparagus officinalis TaxID=4686 RepID=A0A5P1ES82_ASPOF|nr:protein RRP6-like 2 [Asparagus officinalis]ONK68872.1 uncharacterized protein A4U43_C05F16920 [Asparagus officinalis]